MANEAHHKQSLDEMKQFLDAGFKDSFELKAKSNVSPFTTMYRNWRGEVSIRNIIPKEITYGSTDWHPDPQWLLLAYDVDKKEYRQFALKDFYPITGENHG